LIADSESGNNNGDGTNPTIAIERGRTSDNEEEDTDDVATVDDIDEGGDKKTTAKTLIADSDPGNNNEDGTDNYGDGNRYIHMCLPSKNQNTHTELHDRQ
jgi:hypothetical protein